jgi:dCMP deaminase
MALSKWDRRYLAIAREVSCWSKDPSTRVGAVIADKRGRVVALGFNGFAEKVEDCEKKLNHRETKYEMVFHAQVNAALIAGRSTEGGTIYVSGAPICPRCASVLIQVGIKRAVAKEPCPSTGIKWDKDGLIALDMFREVGIEFESADAEQISN